MEKIKNTLFAFVYLVSLSLPLGLAVNKLTNAQADICGTLPSMTLRQSVPSAGRYAVWLLVKKESPTAKPYLNINDGTCDRIDLPAADEWTWVSGTNGTLIRQMNTGENNIRIHIDGGAVLIDKVLATTDQNCLPKGLGQNCLEEAIDFAIEGIEQGSTVTGSRQVRAPLTVVTDNPVAMEFLINDKSVATQLDAPYCLIETTDGCGTYNFSSLGEGQHTLKVIATTEGNQYVEKTVTFTVGSTNIAPASIRDLDFTGVNKTLPDTINLTVDGIKNGDTLSGKRIIKANASGGSGAVTVVFAIGGTDMNSSPKAPYCLVYTNESCGEWDSATLINGNYVLYVKATSPGYKDKILQIPFKVSNSALTSVVNVDKSSVVVGNPNQQLSGTVNLTIPKQVLSTMPNLQTITYSLGDKVIGSGTLNSPGISFDTRTVSNGKYRLSATLRAANGEKVDVTSEVNIRNDIVSSGSSWAKNSFPRAALVSGILIVAFGVLAFFVIRKIRSRRFQQSHNLNTEYYMPMTPTTPLSYATYGVAAVVLVAITSMFVLGGGGTKAGVGLGFVDEMENAVPSANFDGVSLAYDNGMTIYYVRMNYLKPTSSNQPTTPTPPSNPTPPTNGINNGPIGVSRVEVENMELEPSLGRVSNENSASGGQAMMFWSTGSAYQTVNVIAGQGITVRARGDQCLIAPTMTIKIDNQQVMATAVPNESFDEYSVPVTVAQGLRNFEVSFTNDYFSGCDRNLYVDSIEITPGTPENNLIEPQEEPAPQQPTQPTTPPQPTTPTQPTTPVPTTPTTPPSGLSRHMGMGPLINNDAIPGPFPAMNGPVIQYNTGYVPFADSIGAFRTDCSVSHITYDDPIVYPGRPNAAHLHTFFGNSAVNAYTTKESLETTGGSTCNGGILNRSGYWMPTVIDGQGRPVMPERVLVYYKTSYYGVRAQDVIAPPAGLRMIAGNAQSTTVQSRDPYGHSISSFACNSESFPFPPVTGGNSIDTFCPEGARQLFMEIRFPQCWDGVNLDSFDHKSHMAYPTGNGCPSSHPVAIPEIQLRVKYNYYDPGRSSWKLSSDNYEGPGGYSSHADWWNGWDRTTLNKITRNCWNAQRDCQVDNLGDGERLGRNI